jgi:hypothetical protein
MAGPSGTLLFSKPKTGKGASSSSFVEWNVERERNIEGEPGTEYRMRTMSGKTLTQSTLCRTGKSQVEVRRARLLASISIPMAARRVRLPRVPSPGPLFKTAKPLRSSYYFQEAKHASSSLSFPPRAVVSASSSSNSGVSTRFRSTVPNQ